MGWKSILSQLLLLFSGFFIGLYIAQNLSFNSTTMSYSMTTHVIRFPLVAVTENGEGVLEYGELTIKSGHGNIYFKINPFVEPDTQYAFENAVHAACSLLHKNCNEYDFILKINSDAKLVGGPSAGLAFALAVYYGLSNKVFPPYVAATGTIDKNGNVGPVGGILAKAMAAAKAGKKLFIVPKGQEIVYHYERIEKEYTPYPGVTIVQVEYKPIPVNLSKIMYKKYGMRVIGVSSLKEAIRIINQNS